VAGVIGFILVFAGIVTYAAYVAHNEVPKWGAQNEKAYDGQVADVLSRMGSDAAASLGSQASASTTVPPPPGAPSVNIPLIDRTEGAPPSASLSLLPDCGGLDATHDLAGVTIHDVTGGAHGCLSLAEQGTYAGSFTYTTEYGGLLRSENGRSFVLDGPPLVLKSANGAYTVGVTFLETRGAANSVGVGRSGVSVDLVPGPSTTETSDVPNAGSVTWNLTTPSAADASAWADWFNGQIAAAGFTDTASCVNQATPSGSLVQVHFDGPCLTSAPDIALSISYGRYDATLR
jgi:hypothetical protein